MSFRNPFYLLLEVHVNPSSLVMKHNINQWYIKVDFKVLPVKVDGRDVKIQVLFLLLFILTFHSIILFFFFFDLIDWITSDNKMENSSLILLVILLFSFF